MTVKKPFINGPQALILTRALLVPVMLTLAWTMGRPAAWWIVSLMFLGLLTDIFDGIVARKQKLSTENLRRIDSQVDLIFWLSIGGCVWILYPELILSNKYFIALIVVMEGLCYAVSLIRFGKETCTHAFLSKLWAISLLVTFTAMIGFGTAGIPFMITVIMAFVSHVDVILIMLILPKWQHDIPSSYHAWLIRQGKTFKKSDLLNS